MAIVKRVVGQITLKVIRDVASTTYYYLLQSSMAPAPSTPSTNPPTGWSTTEPDFFTYQLTEDTEIVLGKQYYTRTGESEPYTYTVVTTPVAENLNTYYERVYGDTKSLYVTVQTLYTDNTYDYSQPSLSSSYEAAKVAYNRAQTAAELANGLNQYFWFVNRVDEGDNTEAGAHVTSIPSNTFTNSPSGGNVLIQSEGITLRTGLTPMTSWTNDALNFYLPESDSEVGAQVSAQGLIVNKGGISNRLSVDQNENTKLYLSTEDYGSPYSINGYATDSWRQIIGKNFGVTNEGVLYTSGAQISGKFDVIAGSNVYTKMEAQARLAELESATGADQWKNKYGNYERTTDVKPEENVVYYQPVYGHIKTDDTEIESQKIYYLQYKNTVYELVNNPVATELSTYYEGAKTQDESIDSDKEYYIYDEEQLIYRKVNNPTIADKDKYFEFNKTTDTVLQTGKQYFNQRIIYTYEIVDNPTVEDLDNYYERYVSEYIEYDIGTEDNPSELGLYILNNVSQSINDYLNTHLSVGSDGLWLSADSAAYQSGYKIQLTSDGMYVWDTEQQLVSSFGENILFASSNAQQIGGDHTYIKFIPEQREDGVVVKEEELRIVASKILIGAQETDLDTRLKSVEDGKESIEQQISDINDQLGTIDSSRQSTDIYKAYIDIDSANSIMKIGKRNANNQIEDSYIEINASNSDDMRISFNFNQKQVAYFNNERMWAPSAAVTNLYMQARSEGKLVGTLGWVMRSNRHLSLKEIGFDETEEVVNNDEAESGE